MITRIHVNQHTIKSNRKNGLQAPVLSVKRNGKTIYASNVSVLGPCKVVYSPGKPLSCGAEVWLETKADVVLEDAGT
jgi:hypothetical protein